jgi:hypothetical protein
MTFISLSEKQQLVDARGVNLRPTWANAAEGVRQEY